MRGQAGRHADVSGVQPYTIIFMFVDIALVCNPKTIAKMDDK